ncbi:TlpA family protein disulfide reductase [Novipirellula sp. SH528]|uniref:TlpA family protein disulfide reductase n=1 Tax=Novipirellula sp. SH528 TaxID=3454466 RepID=UPI003FA0FD86
MPKNHLNGRFSQSLRNGLSLLALIALFSCLGCGKSSEESPTVPPPESVTPTEQATTPTDPAPSEPPGQLELPPGDIPPANTSSPKSGGGGGLEMPDVQISNKPPIADASETASPEILYGSLQEIQNRVAKTNKITVVDFWSLSCRPCLEEFPGLVRLDKQFADKVQCISVDVDFDGRKSRPPKHYEERVVAFVTSVESTFPNYISTTESDDVYAELDLDSIPAVLIYDADGKLVKKFVDAGDTAGFTYDKQVIPFVKQMMQADN